MKRVRLITGLLFFSAILGANFAGFVVPTGSRAQGTSRVIVIANTSNSALHVTREFVANAFLKRVTRWPQGDLIRPADLSPESHTRRAFAAHYLGRPVSAVRSHWQRIIFAGRGVPPVEFRLESEVIAYVARFRGGIGYVSSNADVTAVKVLVVQ